MIVFKRIIGTIYITRCCVYPGRLVCFNKHDSLEKPKNWCKWYTGKPNKSLEYDIYVGWKKLMKEGWPKRITVAYG